MKTAFTAIRSPAIISSFLILPFMALELINRQGLRAREGFPVALFAVLWLLPVAFILILGRTARQIRTGDTGGRHLITLAAGAACLLVIAWVWGAVVLDQMPCFLGVPNCD
jgi:hypothetical protein